MYPNVLNQNQKDLLNLAASKAYTLGRRSKWKDYVDLYFLTKQFELGEIILAAQNIFENKFNPKLFLEQLSYYEDMDYSEEVEYIGENISKEEIKDSLNTKVHQYGANIA